MDKKTIRINADIYILLSEYCKKRGLILKTFIENLIKKEVKK